MEVEIYAKKRRQTVPEARAMRSETLSIRSTLLGTITAEIPVGTILGQIEADIRRVKKI